MRHQIIRRASRGASVATGSMALVLAVVTGLAACGDGGNASDRAVVRLGYFPNLTHATAIVGVEKGIFADKLGSGVTLQPKIFNAGPSAVEALFSGALDATYIGPNPAVNAWAQSKGKAVRIVAGAASGGAFLVVKPEITSAADLRGKIVATPQLGNTQDVALRYWLKDRGLRTTKEGGGDVQVKPQDNAVTVDTFRTGAIQGAWVPQPTAARLVAAGGRVLVDERELWPDRRFVVTHLLVSTKFLTKHPDLVRRLITGSVEANSFINGNPAAAREIVNQGVGRLTGKPLDATVTADAWPSMTFLDDPLASSLIVGARHAQEVGLLAPVDLSGIYDLKVLNQVLRQRGATEVTA